MGFDGSGTYTRTNGTLSGSNLWQQRAAQANPVISATEHDGEMNDVANALTDCIKANGSKAATGNQPMAGFKHTGVGDATANNQYLTYGQIQTTGVPDIFVSDPGTGASDTATVRLRCGGVGASIGGLYAYNSASVDYGGEALELKTFAPRLVFGTGGFEKARIDSLGRMGIGITDPQTKLHIAGAVPSTANGATAKGTVQIDEASITALTQAGGLEFKNSAANSGYGSRIVGFDDGTIVIARRQNSATWSESMRIDAIGRVGLNTTAPAYQLHLSTDSAAKPTTNTWTIVSDARIKTNVQDYTKGLDEIKQVRPVTYDYNGLGGNPAGPGGISIIAQEIQPIFPECVGTFSAKLNPEDEQETELLNYNGHAITFALINAVKELSAKVEALEAEVTALKGA